MKQQDSFPKNAIVIDVDFINKYLPMLKEHLSKSLNAKLRDMDLAYLCVQMGLMMGLKEEDREEFYVVVVSDNDKARMANTIPNDVADIVDKGCDVGNWSLYFINFNSAGMVTRPERVFEVVDMLISAKGFEKIFLVPEESVVGPQNVQLYLDLAKNHLGAANVESKSFYMGGLQDATRFCHFKSLSYFNLTFAFELSLGMTDEQIEQMRNVGN